MYKISRKKVFSKKIEGLNYYVYDSEKS